MSLSSGLCLHRGARVVVIEHLSSGFRPVYGIRVSGEDRAKHVRDAPFNPLNYLPQISLR
jgi:hypothetical protein